MRKNLKSKEKLKVSRRMKAFAATVLLAITTTATTALADSSISYDYYFVDNNSINKNAWVHSYLAFMNGGIFPDKVWWSASLCGTEGGTHKAYAAVYKSSSNTPVGSAHLRAGHAKGEKDGKVIGYESYVKSVVDLDDNNSNDYGYLYCSSSTAKFVAYK